jgi:hypothetical protein
MSGKLDDTQRLLPLSIILPSCSLRVGIAAALTDTQLFIVSKHLSWDGLTHRNPIHYLLGVGLCPFSPLFLSYFS